MVKKDWNGNKKSVYQALGASSHSLEIREENDFYATPEIATKLLLELETFQKNVWEPACGLGHISKVLNLNGYKVKNSDLIKRDFKETEVIDFLKTKEKFKGDIITNPPYKYAKEFIEKSFEVIENKSKIAMFLKLQFLEGKNRKSLFKKYPPKIVYISSSRLLCALNGDWKNNSVNSGAVCYCWYIWEKGYSGQTILKWFN